MAKNYGMGGDTGEPKDMADVGVSRVADATLNKRGVPKVVLVVAGVVAVVVIAVIIAGAAGAFGTNDAPSGSTNIEDSPLSETDGNVGDENTSTGSESTTDENTSTELESTTDGNPDAMVTEEDSSAESPYYESGFATYDTYKNLNEYLGSHAKAETTYETVCEIVGGQGVDLGTMNATKAGSTIVEQGYGFNAADGTWQLQCWFDTETGGLDTIAIEGDYDVEQLF